MKNFVLEILLKRDESEIYFILLSFHIGSSKRQFLLAVVRTLEPLAVMQCDALILRKKLVLNNPNYAKIILVIRAKDKSPVAYLALD